MIYIYVKGSGYQKSNGIAVIVNNFLKYCKESGLAVSCIRSLNGLSTDNIVIPYGPKESMEIINLGYKAEFSLLVDAISLGYLNKIIHYLKTVHFFHKDFLYSIYGYLRYSLYEKKIVKKFKKIILVSQTDIDYLQRGEARDKFICLKNGINFPKVISKKSKSKKLRIGILSMWDSYQSTEENRWILRKYISKYIKSHSDVEFILAGRGKRIQQFALIPSIKIIGEVTSLDDFFSNIDVFLSPNPKGCGILNRVLDAIAYNTPIIGHKNSFSGFRGMEKGFLSFDDYTSFCSIIQKIKSRDLQASLVSEASKFAYDNLIWEKNYINFINQYMKPFVL